MVSRMSSMRRWSGENSQLALYARTLGFQQVEPVARASGVSPT